MWVDISECILGIDRDGDGEASGGTEYAHGGETIDNNETTNNGGEEV